MAELKVKVVLNDEGQYSVWPQERANPPGWHDEGFSGTKQDCLEHIDAVWTDMRAKSLWVAMEDS